MTKDGAIRKEHPAEFYDGPGDHDHHPPVDNQETTNSGMEVVNHEETVTEMNLETVE